MWGSGRTLPIRGSVAECASAIQDAFALCRNGDWLKYCRHDSVTSDGFTVFVVGQWKWPILVSGSTDATGSQLELRANPLAEFHWGAVRILVVPLLLTVFFWFDAGQLMFNDVRVISLVLFGSISSVLIHYVRIWFSIRSLVSQCSEVLVSRNVASALLADSGTHG